MLLALRFLIVYALIVWAQPLWACESCAIVYLGKKEKPAGENKQRLTAKVFYENQDWAEIPAAEAHQLHHQGHDAHDKQDEQVIHAIINAQLFDRFSVEADIPYVRRHYIEIDSHAHLGENQISKGLGDVTLTGDYSLVTSEDKTFGILAGIKFPSGKIDEETSFGSLVEPELQPGTGSYDYIAGLTGSAHPGAADFSVSAVYVYKTEGDQNFRFGNLFSVSLYAGKRFDLKDNLQLKTGLMISNQLEQKQHNDGDEVKDSGGYTMLIGPQAGLSCQNVSLDISFLAPAVQNLGGTHQKLDTGILTSAVSIKF